MTNMPILGINNQKMGTPFFQEFKKHASFFLKEKIKTARLALTDVTPAELLTEEATNGNLRSPDTRTMGLISRAAFGVDDYWRIVGILHKRLMRFDRNHWKVSYDSMILLEHLLTHGPESVAEEFQSDRDVILEMQSFQYIDERGFNWGITVRKKSERISKLLEKGSLLKEERDRARKLTRGIEGFGSFCMRSSKEIGTFSRCNSNFTDYEDQKDLFPTIEEASNSTETQQTHEACNKVLVDKPAKICDSLNEVPIIEKYKTRTSSKDMNSLLGCQKDDSKIENLIEEDHPFNNHEHQTSQSLLSS